MELAWYIYPLAIVAGIVAGIINTLAGSGSAVTLPMMDLMGLPAPVVLVCLGDTSEYPAFQRKTQSRFPWLIAPPLDFMDMIGDAPPRLYLLRNGQPLKVWEGDHVDTDIVIAEATDLVGAR